MGPGSTSSGIEGTSVRAVTSVPANLHVDNGSGRQLTTKLGKRRQIVSSRYAFNPPSEDSRTSTGPSYPLRKGQVDRSTK